MKVFAHSVVFPKELASFLNCHLKTAKKRYAAILGYYKKDAHGLLSLEEVASYYQLPIDVLKEFER